MSTIGSAELAAQLGVSRRRANQILRDRADLAVRDETGAWRIARTAAMRLARQHRGKRGLGNEAAWGLLALLEGDRPTWISDSTLARLRRRLRDDSPQALVSALGDCDAARPFGASRSYSRARRAVRSAMSPEQATSRAGLAELSSLRDDALAHMASGVRGKVEPSVRGGYALLSASEAARLIRQDLARGDESWAARHLSETVERLRHATGSDFARGLLRQPASTGDRRWDTLLGAAIARTLELRGITPPAWTDRPALGSEWMPGDAGEASEALRERIRAATPEHFLSKNILVRDRDLAVA